MKCKDCGRLTSSSKYSYCKKCGYKYRKRPSGLKYNTKVRNKSWFKSGHKLNPIDSHPPYFDADRGYYCVHRGGRRIHYHRYLMEQHLGRKLNRGEVVHHKNHDKLDNRIENLCVMTASEHTRLHHFINRIKFNLLTFNNA
jgi:putative hemolysin